MSAPSGVSRRALLTTYLHERAEEAAAQMAEAQRRENWTVALETDLLAFGPDVLAETARSAGLDATTGYDEVARVLSGDGSDEQR